MDNMDKKKVNELLNRLTSKSYLTKKQVLEISTKIEAKIARKIDAKLKDSFKY